MKRLNSRRLCLTFAGCFLGAGYVSGQEVWQFFGVFGAAGYAGLAVAMALICGFGILLIRLAQATGIEEMDLLVVRWNVPWLRGALAALECAFLFGLMTIMGAGACALFSQLWGLPQWLVGTVYSLILIAVALRGISGLVGAFSLLVPILVAVTVAAGAAAWVRFPGTNTLPSRPLHALPLSTVTFFAYNVFSAIGILTPLGRHVGERKTVWLGVGGGSVVLGVIALSVLRSLYGLPGAGEAELPMLFVAERLSPALAYVYGGLLLLAMFGTSLSSLVALLTFFGQKSAAVRARRAWWTVGLTLLAQLGSRAGFGNLIGVLYPLFGYLSLFFLALLAEHYFHVRRTRPELLRGAPGRIKTEDAAQKGEPPRDETAGSTHPSESGSMPAGR